MKDRVCHRGMSWWQGQDTGWSHLIHAQEAGVKDGVETLRGYRKWGWSINLQCVPLVYTCNKTYTPRSFTMVPDSTTSQGLSVQTQEPMCLKPISLSHHRKNKSNIMSSSHTEDQRLTQSQFMRKQPLCGRLGHMVPDSRVESSSQQDSTFYVLGAT